MIHCETVVGGVEKLEEREMIAEDGRYLYRRGETIRAVSLRRSEFSLLAGRNLLEDDVTEVAVVGYAVRLTMHQPQQKGW
jgi:hypothetical protein